jgi:hypothetical protein
MDLIAKAGPAQVIGKAAGSKTGAQIREEYRRARCGGRLQSQKIKFTKIPSLLCVLGIPFTLPIVLGLFVVFMAGQHPVIRRRF